MRKETGMGRYMCSEEGIMGEEMEEKGTMEEGIRLEKEEGQ